MQRRSERSGPVEFYTGRPGRLAAANNTILPPNGRYRRDFRFCRPEPMETDAYSRRLAQMPQEDCAMKKRLCSVLLTVSLLMTMFPTSVLAAPKPSPREPVITQAHDGCDLDHAVAYEQGTSASAVIVTSFSQLSGALGNAAVTDIVLRPATDTEATWYVTSQLSVTRTVHLSVAEGYQVTLERDSGMSQAFFSVSATTGHLILGDGQMTKTEAGTHLDAVGDAQPLYTYETERRGGALILDGGAVWTKGDAYTPGTQFYNADGTKAVFYDLEEGSDTYGQQRCYTNSGLRPETSLIWNQGTLDLWDGVTLQNNVKKSNYGSAINSAGGSTLNMYGGLITRCAAAGSKDEGQGAVYVGKSGVEWTSKPQQSAATFTMYGGSITNNAATNGQSAGSNGFADGGGVALDQAHMVLYGGEISYNHAGVWLAASAGDGGGIMVRCGSVLDMYGGSVHHNYAGGYGGGIVAWNGDVNLYAGEVTQNVGGFGGGIGIAAHNNVTSFVRMYGGTVAYNEAISAISGAGYGGGICAGSSTYKRGAHLDLQGGTIQQNKAAYGGGIAVYAEGDGTAQASNANTEVTMSGDFALTGNSANYNGNGMYVTNTSATNLHTLLTMSGAARIDTNNPVYFNNVCTDQVPVRVSGNLTTAGTAAIFQFSDAFWNNTAWDYAHAAAGMNLIAFDQGLDIQENKFALESTTWYLSANTTDSALELQKFSDTPLYTIRNDTPVTVEGKKYYRLYTSLDDAFDEAADGDTLYIFYTTTVDTPAVLEGKDVTLLAESNYSAANAASKVITGKETTFSSVTGAQGYQVVEGDFLKYVGSGTTGISDNRYNVTGTSATSSTSGAYVLDVGEGNDFSTTYNVRNDYTITLASSLYLGESSRSSGGVSPAAQGAIVVQKGANLEIGKTADVTEGAGWLNFDGNLSYPTEGPMFQIGGSMTIHSGITIKNHANYSEAHPGALEVTESGSLTINDGVTIQSNVSPITGAVYNKGTFTMAGGTMADNTGAMPRYGFQTSGGTKLSDYDTAYWGQPKYYYGAGAIYNLGTFTMTGGTVSGNRGEYGALAQIGGTMTLSGGSITGNSALIGDGTGTDYALTITGYTEAANPSRGTQIPEDAGNGGGLYVSGGNNVKVAGVSFADNYAAKNGGGIAIGNDGNLTRTITGYQPVDDGLQTVTGSSGTQSIQAAVPTYSGHIAENTMPIILSLDGGASVTGNEAAQFGGGVFAEQSNNTVTLAQDVTLRDNRAKAGGGLAAIRGAEITFSNNVTENTADYGGGIYVGSSENTEPAVVTATATAQITANQADHGGGAYIDDVLDGAPADPGNLPDSVTKGTAGQLVLHGAFLNNNALNSAAGLGTGVYNRGQLVLEAGSTETTAQPYISANDVVYLEEGHFITTGANVTLARNSLSPLTVQSRRTDNGTEILQAAAERDASTFLTEKRVAHASHPLAQKTDDKTIIEINSYSITYHTALPSDPGAASSLFAYTPGQSVTVLDFGSAAAGEGTDADDDGTVDGFTLPTGKLLQGWAEASNDNGTWKYVNADGGFTDDITKAKMYSAGSTISAINRNYDLVAVYTDARYSITLDYTFNYDQNYLTAMGKPKTDMGPLGSLNLSDGVSYDGANQTYYVNNGVQFTITPEPVQTTGPNTLQGVFQGLEIYQEVDQETYNGLEEANRYQKDNRYYQRMASTVLESETLASDGEKLYSTGVITGVDSDKASGTGSAVFDNGVLKYTAADSNVLIRAVFKQGMVRLDIHGYNDRSDLDLEDPVYTGWYDTMAMARQAMQNRFDNLNDAGDGTFTASAPTDGSCTFSDIALEPQYNNFASMVTLLAANTEEPYGTGDDALDRVYLAGSKDAGMPDNTNLNGTEERTLYMVWELNGFALDMGAIGEQTLEYRDLTIQNGVLHSPVDKKDATLAADDPNDSIFHIKDGALRLENVQLAAENANFNVRLMQGGVLDLGYNAQAGAVYLETVYENGQPQYDQSAYVTVSDDFLTTTAAQVATLYLDPGGDDIQRQPGQRYVLRLTDDVATANGHLIRSKFALAEADTAANHKHATPIAEAPEITKWFIGTDGKLYRRVAYVETSAYCDSHPNTDDPIIATTWDWSTDGGGAPNTKDYGREGFTLPIYYQYTRTFSYDPDEHSLTLKGQVLDADGKPVTWTSGGQTVGAGGSMTFVVTRLEGAEGSRTETRYYIDTSCPVNNTATATSGISRSTLGGSIPANQPAEGSTDIYLVSATWTGANQYAAAYADYWIYEPDSGSAPGFSDNILTGGATMTITPKEISDSAVVLEEAMPTTAEWIGQAGANAGYTASPSFITARNRNLDSIMVSGVEFGLYFVKLTTDQNQAVDPAVSMVLNGTTYYYEADANGKKQYFLRDTSLLPNAPEEVKTELGSPKNLNSADAGTYSVELYALEGSSYKGLSGWKEQIFTIYPYSGALYVEGTNHLVVGDNADAEAYRKKLTDALFAGASQVQVTDRYGNALDFGSCAFTFEPVSADAQLSSNGWPMSQGLYNLVVTPYDTGVSSVVADGTPDPNYSVSAVGALPVLLTEKPLNVFIVPEDGVAVPYKGAVYTETDVEAYDRDTIAAGSYQVWMCKIDEFGHPVNASGTKIEVGDIPTQGDNARRLMPAEYNLQIGTPRQTPKDVGSYTLLVTDVTGRYIGISALTIETSGTLTRAVVPSEMVYTGRYLYPSVSVTTSDGTTTTQLVRNQDYVVEIHETSGQLASAPRDAGTYTYKIRGINNYAESRATDVPFTVNPKKLDNSDDAAMPVEINMPSAGVWSAGNVGLTVTITYNGARLASGTDYTIAYYRLDDNGQYSPGDKVETMTAAGDYAVVITGKGNFSGTVTKKYTLLDLGKDAELDVSAPGSLTYSGCTFDAYNWEDSAVITVKDDAPHANADLTGAAYRYEVYKLDEGIMAASPVPDDTRLDAGSYAVKVIATLADGTTELTGWSSLTIEPRTVIVTVNEASKIYGTADPALTYTTDLAAQTGQGNVDSTTGFYVGDHVSGSFGRAPGEDAQDTGYDYTIGTFSAGGNYTVLLSTDTTFRIAQKAVGTGLNKDAAISAQVDRQVAYTGYAVAPVRSVTYTPEGGTSHPLQAGRDYQLSYEVWKGATKEDGTVYTPDEEGALGDWSALGSVPVDVGYYRVIVNAAAATSLPNNYTGAFAEQFQIVRNTDALELVLGQETAVYKAAPYTITATVQAGGSTINTGFYDLTYTYTPFGGGTQSMGVFTPGQTKMENAGVYTIYVVGKSNYAGAGGSKAFTIQRKDLAEDNADGGTQSVAMQIADGQSFTYTGEAQRAEITATYGGLATGGLTAAESLESGRDYTLAYQNHTNAGTATVTVTGSGNYTGSRVLTYAIQPQPLTVTVDGAEKVYGANDPAYTYTLKNAEGAEVTGLTLTGSVAVENPSVEEQVGTYSLSIGTLSAGGNYKLELTAGQQLTVTAKPLTENGNTLASYIGINHPSYLAVQDNQSYTIENLKPSSATYYWAPKLGQKDIDYTMEVADVTDDGNSPVAAGDTLTSGNTYQVTLTGTGNYTGTYTYTVQAVNAEYFIKLGDGGAYTYNRTGHEVVLTPTLASGSPLPESLTWSVTGSTLNGKALPEVQHSNDQHTITLKEAGTYTIIVTAKDSDEKGYFGTVTYVVQPKNIRDGDDAHGTSPVGENTPTGDFGWTGSEVVPTNADSLLSYYDTDVPRIEDGTTNYILSYSNNINPSTTASKAQVTITGVGNYSGSRTIEYSIGETRYQVSYDLNGAAGTAPVDPAFYEADKTVTVMSLPANAIAPEGTVFVGWSTAAITENVTAVEQLGTWYQAGSGFVMGRENVTLYAIWAVDANGNGRPDYAENTYTVTYRPGGSATGTPPTDNGLYMAGDTVTIRHEGVTMARDGYTLLGWTMQAPDDGTHTIGTMEKYQTFIRQYSMYPPAAGATFTMPASDVTLYAVWATDSNGNGTADWMENEYIFVYYDANGGAGSITPEIVASTDAGVTYTVKGDADSLTKPNAVLVGWTLGDAYDGFVTAASQLDGSNFTFTPELNTEYHYHPFDTQHTIQSTDGQMVIFHALWAEDRNGNGAPDYQETKYTVSYQNAAADTVTATMPTDDTQYLSGLHATVHDFTGTATYGEGKAAQFLGWTTDMNAAQTLYTRDHRLPVDLTVYQGGAAIEVTANTTLYALWAAEDYLTASYTVTATVLGGNGTATANPATVLEGGSATITITPYTGYRLGAIQVNSQPYTDSLTPDASGNYTLTLTNIHENKAVVVSFSRGSFTVDQPAQATYNGADQTPTLTVKDGSTSLTENTHYTVSWTKNGQAVTELVDAGSYVAEVTGKDDTAYEGAVRVVHFTISPKNLGSTDISVTGISDQEYTGQPVVLPITVTDTGIGSGTPLTKGQDYTVSYQKEDGTAIATPSEPGRYQVILTGTGNYTGTVTETFQIIRDAITIVPAADQSKTFGAADPPLTYKAYRNYGEAGQTEAPVSGQLARKPGENVGSYAYDVSGLSAGTATIVLVSNPEQFTIQPKSLAENDRADDTEPVSVAAIPDQVYDGSPKIPVPVVTYTTQAGQTLALAQDQDFTVAYYLQSDRTQTVQPTAVGTYVAVLTAKDDSNYTGTREVTFEIVDASGGLTVTPSHTSATFDRGDHKPELTVSFNGQALDAANYTATYTCNGGAEQDLTNDTKFVDAGTYVITVEATGGYTGSATATVVISPAELTSVTLSEYTFSYDGTAKKPTVQTVKAGDLTLTDSEYTASIPQNAIAAGTYTVTVTANSSNFTGSATANFTISTGTGFTVGDVPDHVYDGAPYQPKPVVTDGSTPLTEGRDYTLSYSGDVPLAVGNYTITVNGAGSYDGQAGIEDFEIVAKDIANTQIGSGRVEIRVDDAVYDGTAKKPTVVVTYRTADGRVLFLTEGTDYILFYNDNTAAGTGRVTVTGQGNYTGKETKTFTIAPAAGSNLSVSVDPQHLSYNGNEQEPAITVKDGGTPLTQGTHYTVSYAAVDGTGAALGTSGKPLHAGAYTVQIAGKGNYDGYAGSATFVITPVGMAGGTVTVSGSYTYDGDAQTPSGSHVTVTVGGKTLVEGTDYELAYANNVNAGGNAVVTAIGKGDYSGALNGTFTIGKATLTITPVGATKTYGEADDELDYTHNGADSATFSGALSRDAGEDVDSYNIHLGTLTETSGNYTLELSGNPQFTITAKDITDVGGAAELEADGLTVGYTGSAWNGALSLVYDADLGNLALVKDTDYTLTFTQDNGDGQPVEVEPIAAGTYTVTVAGDGNYTGEFAFELTIDPAQLGVEITGGGVVVYDGTDQKPEEDDLTIHGSATNVQITYYAADGTQVEEIVNAGSYQVVVSADNYDSVTLPFVVLKKQLTADMVSDPADAIYTGEQQMPPVAVVDGASLAADDYTVAYGVNINAGTGLVTVTATADGNYFGTVVKTFAINPLELTADNTVVTPPADVEYNGAAQYQEPTVTVEIDSVNVPLTLGADYTLSYTGEAVHVTGAGVTVSVTGTGNFTGTVTDAATYRITQRSIADSIIEIIPSSMSYTGSELKPAVIVRDTLSGRDVTLTEDVDYTLSYSANTDTGTATVTITGKGDYTGETFANFTITAAGSGQLSIDPLSPVTYNGAEQKPTLMVTAGNTPLAETGYTVVWTRNGQTVTTFIDAGVYVGTVTAVGGNYDGAQGTVTYVIRPAELTSVTLEQESFDYTGSPIEPQVTSVTAGALNVPVTSYRVVYSNNQQVGTASVTVFSTNPNYTGSVTKEFEITAGSLYAVTYNRNGADGGSVPVDNGAYLTGDTVTLLDNSGILTKTGAVFLGWSTTKAALLTSEAEAAQITIVQPGATMRMLSGGLTLYAVWAQDSNGNGRPDYRETVTIISSAGPGGTIAPSGSQSYAWGTESAAYTITVEGGYTFTGVTVDDVNVAVSTDQAPTALVKNPDGTYTYTFGLLTENHTIAATFQAPGGSGGGGGGGTPPVEMPDENTPLNPDETGVSSWLRTDTHDAYVNGYPDGTFQPDQNMTRAEAAQLFYNLLLDKNVPVTVQFADVEPDAWYAQAVNTLASLGFIEGVGHGLFQPERTITRGEFTAIAMRFASLEYNGQIRFSDVPEDAWYHDYVVGATEYGWINGYPDGTFRPTTNITRSEVTVVVNQMLGRRADRTYVREHSETLAVFTDLPTYYWSYFDVMEAANSHGHRWEEGNELWTGHRP